MYTQKATKPASTAKNVHCRMPPLSLLPELTAPPPQKDRLFRDRTLHEGAPRRQAPRVKEEVILAHT